jgi:HPt (histidine-containing phosphotransfer) domain-containing protein
VTPAPAEPFELAAPATGQPAAVQAAFTRLRAQFVAGLSSRWQEIEMAADATTQRAALHRLAGAAGSYGFVELGQAARAAEALFDDSVSAARDAALRDAVHALRQQLQAAGATV